MSDIKIQPSATGSATVTLTAPATGTARTITLPDSTDTLAVNSDVTNKLPLAGGTMTGTLNVNNTLPTIKLTDTNSGGYYSSVNQEGSSFKILADEGNVGSGQIRFYVGSGAEKVRILSSGGITFNGDTAAANALDDYEEGSGNSSVIAVKLGSTALTVSGVGYKYTKIGNVVHFQFEFRITNLNGASSGAFTVGLPFTADNGGYAAGALRIYNGVVDGNEFVHSDHNSNLLYLSRRVNNAATANVTATNNAYYFGQLTYITT
jgi:hypothetical protein